LSGLSEVYSRLPENGTTDNLSEVVGVITESATTISALFTTILGLVLGHFFGQRGQESAERARVLAEKSHDETIEDLEDDSGAAATVINELISSLELSNAAVSQTLGILEEYAPDGVDVDDASPLGRLLASDEESS